MNDWQRTFLGKLESAKKHWLRCFEDVARDTLVPIFEEFAEFATAHGLTASSPACEPGTRFFKFGLTENGYVLLSFRMHGLDGVAFTADYSVPGPDEVAPSQAEVHLADADEAWARKQFEHALERFVVVFGEASAHCAEQLVRT